MHSNGRPRRIATSSGSAGFDACFGSFCFPPFSPAASSVFVSQIVCGRLIAAAAETAGGKRTLSCLGAQNDSLGVNGRAVSASLSLSPRLGTIGPLSRTFARKSREYFSKSGTDSVLPLKLGSFKLIRGPNNPGPEAGIASEHKPTPETPSRRVTVSDVFVFVFVLFPFPFPGRRLHPPFTNVSAALNTEGGRVFRHHPCVSSPPSTSSAPSPRSKRANRDGNPHVFTP
mmetsp:Transcript_402/g.1567  ORF Transcript_402/g.1567 Transcript_402/m.1567 type:complete len:229 (+) Transcript_402:140-826(+)